MSDGERLHGFHPHEPLGRFVVNGGSRPTFRLAESLEFGYWFAGGGLWIEVPAGFETDFASVPRLFWPLFPPTGKWRRAAIVHDYLCDQPDFPRFLATAIFREAMRCLGVPAWQRWCMYVGVRMFEIFTGK